MSALLSAMASSRSSCSCRRSRASLSCSAFSLSRLAHASCCSSLPNCEGKTEGGLHGPGAGCLLAGAGRGGGVLLGEEAEACRGWTGGCGETQCWGVCGKVPGVQVKTRKRRKPLSWLGRGRGRARPSPAPPVWKGSMH